VTATPPPADALAARILDALPQTQCTRCGYPDCAAYAQAIAAEQAPINQCPPGGAQGIERLSAITGQAVLALNPEFGLEGPRTVAFIDEDWCIGCTLCIDACPTDAIYGTNKRMHSVIEEFCTGCELCIPVCPVDCILLEPVHSAEPGLASPTGWDAWSDGLAYTARTRYAAAQSRRAQSTQAKRAAKAEEAADKLSDLAKHSRISDPTELERKKALIEAAMARARQRKPE
jgi:electron transport complex protein RnfB